MITKERLEEIKTLCAEGMNDRFLAATGLQHGKTAITMYMKAVPQLIAEVELLRDVLKRLSDRHKWSQDLGGCVCEAHRQAEAILNETEKP